VDQLEEALLQSVEMQLAADVPVGALCSGGVDSSVIMAMARKFHNNLAIFHADVVSDSECDAAAALAKHLALDLKTVKVTDQDFIELMPEVMEHYGHPYSLRPNAVPILLVSKLVRSNGIKAVLTGEGSDECFIGYPYNIPNLTRFMHELPLRVYHALPRLGRRLLTGDIRGFDCELRAFHPKASRDYFPDRVQMGSLQNRFERELEYEEIRSESARIKGKQPGPKDMIALEQMSYELRTLLHRNDSQGMAASVECRFPFLDSRVVKLAVNIPYRCKVRFSPTTLEKEHLFLRDKWVLRQVADRYLPRSLSRRKKVGFPTDTYRRTRIADEFFEDSLVADLFELDREGVRYLTGHADEALKRKLLHVEVWAHVCLRDAPRDKIIEKLRNHLTVRPR
jgi:asparagine synthase (glutamine-hydrolysing)